MTDREFISANELPEASGEEVSVICLENGELKQKHSSNLSGSGGGVMIVTVTTVDNTSTPDKTYAEIKAAIDEGQIVRLFDVSGNQYFELTFLTAVMVCFTSVAYYMSALTYTEWNIYNYESLAYKSTKTITVS